MGERLYEALAKQLLDARHYKKPITCLTAHHPELTLKDAYAIQQAVIQLRQKNGEKVIGYKMGLTSKVKQEQMQIATPVFGILTDSMLMGDTSLLTFNHYVQPKAEPEIAFMIGRDLFGDVSIEEALDACEGISIAIDIIDSSYENFKFSLVDIVADDCSAGSFLLHSRMINPHRYDLANLGVSLFVNDQLVHSGSSSNVLGHPAEALVMLVRMLAERNEALRAGTVVLSGGMTAAITLAPGAHISARIEHLGELSFLVEP